MADKIIEFPKWVEPHHSHVITQDGINPLVQGFPFYAGRDQTVIVLVQNADEEKLATSPAAVANSEDKVQDGEGEAKVPETETTPPPVLN